MASLDSAARGGVFSDDAWVWWQARRLRYNLTLAAGGWVAYGLGVGLNHAVGHPLWKDWRGGLAMTIFLGVFYLVVMGVANVAYLLGPAIEGWVRPVEVERYRKTAFTMGLWGSLLVPAIFPLAQFAQLLAHGYF